MYPPEDTVAIAKTEVGYVVRGFIRSPVIVSLKVALVDMSDNKKLLTVNFSNADEKVHTVDPEIEEGWVVLATEHMGLGELTYCIVEGKVIVKVLAVLI